MPHTLASLFRCGDPQDNVQTSENSKQKNVHINNRGKTHKCRRHMWTLVTMQTVISTTVTKMEEIQFYRLSKHLHHARTHTLWRDKDRKPHLSIGGRVPAAKGAGDYEHELLLLEVGLVVVLHAVDGAGKGAVKQVLDHVGIALGAACLRGVENGGLHTTRENFSHHSPGVTHHSAKDKRAATQYD